MKYVHQEKVHPGIAERSKRDIEAINAWIDKLHGTIAALEVWTSGQPGPYKDSVMSGLLHLHSPNVFTTGGPSIRTVTRAQAKVMIEILANQGEGLPEEAGWSTYLQVLQPHKDPCELETHPIHKAEGRSHCWHFVIRTPYCD